MTQSTNAMLPHGGTLHALAKRHDRDCLTHVARDKSLGKPLHER